MPTLKEIKGRIGSVKSTLKITSAMKLVSSAKLRKAQNAIAVMRPYQQKLEAMLELAAGEISPLASLGRNDNNVPPGRNDNNVPPGRNDALSVMPGQDRASGIANQVGNDNLSVISSGAEGEVEKSHAVIIALASNSSLCGGFNANVIAKVRSVRKPGDVVYSIGRKMADAMARDGFRSPADFSALSEHPAYAGAAELVEKVSEDFYAGKISGVTLVYTHFESTSRQVPVVERLLPTGEISPLASLGRNDNDVPLDRNDNDVPLGRNDNDVPLGRNDNDVPPGRNDNLSVISSGAEGGVEKSQSDTILEPSARELMAELLPRTLKLKLFAALLDSAAAEHAARTVAMQTATDNAEDLLSQLTLQYNKGRQYKITSEILDLAGGQASE